MSRALAIALAVSLTSAGLVGRAEAFRTAADTPGFEGTERVRWATTTVDYELSSWLPPGADMIAIEGAVRRGFSAWTLPDCADVAFEWYGFTPASPSGLDGRVTVKFVGQGWSATLGFDPSAAATTDIRYALGPNGQWEITDADLYLNAEGFAWEVDGVDPGARDVETVVTHEVGHALGLLHPCEAGGADGAPACAAAHDGLTMHPVYFGLEQRSLEGDDVAGVCFLYPPSACATDGCADGLDCTPLGCAERCDGIVCAVGDRCGPHGCTREPCAPGSCERGCEDMCETAGGADGDPCVADLECLSATCSAGGYCTHTCVEAACPAGFTCNASAECTAQGGVFGASCDEAADCSSGACLLDSEGPPICTRSCAAPEPACPAGYTCGTVEGADVCIGPGAGSGCTLAAGRARGPARAGWVLGALLALLAARRRRAIGGTR